MTEYAQTSFKIPSWNTICFICVILSLTTTYDMTYECLVEPLHFIYGSMYYLSIFFYPIG
jgi:hypothetical protein